MNKHRIVLIFVILFMGLINGCDEHKNYNKTKKNNVIKTKTTQAVQINIEPGKMYDNVACNNNPGYSYAIYLPENYNDTSEFPVLFLFDAHARGSMPVRKYKDVADEFSLIIACSNNSKNGLSSSEINMISYSFINDIQSRFRVKKSQIFTGGFSGGARVAVEVADMDKAVKGVIGCGAGVPNESFIQRIDFSYFLTAGDKDFNFKELRQLAGKLKKAHINYCFYVFDGKHDWPPAKVIKTAIYFLLLNNAENLSAESPIVKKYISFEKQNLKEAQNTNDIVEQIAIYERMTSTLNKIKNTISYQKKLKILYTTKIWAEHKKNLEAALKKETEMQRFFRQAIAGADTQWWNNEIDKLYINSKEAPSKEERLMNIRLLNYLSLISYMYADNALKNNRLPEAQNYLFIYEKVDPDNTEVYYLKAVYYALQNQNNLAIKELQTAIKKGFDDFERLNRDPHFRFSEAEKEMLRKGKQ